MLNCEGDGIGRILRAVPAKVIEVMEQGRFFLP